MIGRGAAGADDGGAGRSGGRTAPVRARSFDWEEAYGRMERVRRALEAGSNLLPEDVRRILKARAEEEARPAPPTRRTEDLLDLVVFEAAGGLYAVPALSVHQVMAARGVLAMPGTGPLFPGAMLHAGRAYPVLALGPVLGLDGAEEIGKGYVVTVEAGGMTLGIQATAVRGVTQVSAADLQDPPARAGGARPGLLRGVADDMVAVLDLEALARDHRLHVDQAAG
jgi:chemotaxis signal transduction protein